MFIRGDDPCQIRRKMADGDVYSGKMAGTE